MKTNLLKTTLWNLLFVWLLAWNQTTATEVVEKSEKTTKPFLFELTHKLNPACKGYYLCTDHHLPMSIFSQPVLNIIGSAKTVFSERAHTELSFELMTQLGAFSSTLTNWESKLSPDELAAVKNIFFNAAKIKPDFGKYGQIIYLFKPWAILGLLSMAEGATHPQNIAGMDSYFHFKSYQGEITLIGLSTLLDDILSYGLPSLSDDEAIKFIRKRLNSQDDIKDERLGRELYLQGDLDRFETYAWDTDESDEILNMKSIYAINKIMIKNFIDSIAPKGMTTPKIIDIMCPFIIDTGLAHAIGKEGFLNDDLIKDIFYIKRITDEGLAEDFTYSPTR